MILSGPGIVAARASGELDVSPWEDAQLNPNSYDLRLGPVIYGYAPGAEFSLRDGPPPHEVIPVPEDGLLLLPGRGYLAATLERTRASWPWVPLLEGKSSVGRAFLSVHVSAGFGDVGFDGHWTLELLALHPVRVRAGDRICQVYFVRADGPPPAPYAGRYADQVSPAPVPLRPRP